MVTPETQPGTVLGVIPARYGATRFPGKPLASLWGKPHVHLATLAHPEPDPMALASDHVVKMETDADGWALYFTRHWPPPEWAGGDVLRHVGVYGFRRPFLIEFASWPPGRHEQAERLEQLRAVERGVRIKVFATERPAAGVDTPEQLAALERRGPQD